MNAEKIKHEITFAFSQKFQFKFGWIPSLSNIPYKWWAPERTEMDLIT